MPKLNYDFEAAKQKLRDKTERLSALIDAANLLPDQRKEFWRLIAERTLISRDIEASRCRMAMEKLLEAEAGTVPWEAREFLKFEPTYLKLDPIPEPDGVQSR